MSTETARCSGHCCRDFTLPFSPEEIRMKALKSQKSEHDNPLDWKRDIAMIADMLIFLRVDRQEHSLRSPTKQILYHYTCKHLDRATNNCTAYDARPAMCRDYPYQIPPRKDYGPRAYGQCNYRDCTRRCDPKELELLKAKASEEYGDLKKFEEEPCQKP